MVARQRWADLPEDVRDDLERRAELNVMARAARTAERRRQRALRDELRRQGKLRPSNLDRVNPSRIQRSALAAAERSRVLQIELDKLTGERRRRWNQREIIEASILAMERRLRRALRELVDQMPSVKERVQKAMDWQPVTGAACYQRDAVRPVDSTGVGVGESPTPVKTPNECATNGRTG